MPRFDGTGPQGRGPGTGRGLGLCGYGFHHFWGYHPRHFRRPSRTEELTSLEEEEKFLQEELEAVREEKKALKASK